MKPKEINVNTIDEFKSLVENKDISIAKAVIESIIKNIKTRKKHIHVLSVQVVEENTVFDITLEKQYFKSTLEENLKHFEVKEMYEECSKIHDAIAQLK
jgi:hypothetical protein|tara:strand:+ start:3628 stop:3924 length:297 start_codon:yes stop_codon:yes gene_type:complete